MSNKSNKDKLLDLYVDGSISREVYNNRLSALIRNDIINQKKNNKCAVSKFSSN